MCVRPCVRPCGFLLGWLATVAVCPSTDPEGFGRVPVEAQAMGRPIIASNHGGAQETIINGFKDFRPFLGHCKFRDCQHQSDAGCALVAASKNGDILQSRLLCLPTLPDTTRSKLIRPIKRRNNQ